MQISPINSNTPSYKARLSKRQVNNLILAAKKSEPNDGIPKLYTLLDLLDKHSGKVATYSTEVVISKFRSMGKHGSRYASKTYNTLCIDNIEIKKGSNSKLDVLKSAVTDYKGKDGKIMPMPESVFDQMWWINRGKTEEDVKNFGIEI